MLRDRDLVPNRKQRIHWKKGSLALIPAFFSALLLAYLIHRLWIFPYVVVNEEMSPQFPPSTTLYINRRFHNDALQPGRVVLVRYPGNDEFYILRRIAAVGGESIEIQERKISINGGPLPESRRQFLQAPTLPVGMIPAAYSRRDTMPSVTVPSGSLFLLCDNRLSGTDSRDLGPVPVDLVVGVVEY